MATQRSAVCLVLQMSIRGGNHLPSGQRLIITLYLKNKNLDCIPSLRYKGAVYQKNIPAYVYFYTFPDNIYTRSKAALTEPFYTMYFSPWQQKISKQCQPAKTNSQ